MISECYLVEPFVCKETDTVADVGTKLRKFDQRHIFVVADDKPVGIISVTDILDKVVSAGKNAAQVIAKEVMTKDILIFDDGDDVRKAYKAMFEKKIVSCAITQHDKIVGILTLKEAISSVTNPKNIFKGM